MESDGQIVVAGSCVVVAATVGTNDFCLARYNPDGSLDTTGFGAGGTVTTHIGGTFDISVANGVAIQGDGRIVAAGYCGPSPYDFCLARYTSAGVLGTTFGSGGTVISAIGTGNDLPLGRPARILPDARPANVPADARSAFLPDAPQAVVCRLGNSGPVHGSPRIRPREASPRRLMLAW